MPRAGVARPMVTAGSSLITQKSCHTPRGSIADSPGPYSRSSRPIRARIRPLTTVTCSSWFGWRCTPGGRVPGGSSPRPST
jgi:hypothetical protein